MWLKHKGQFFFFGGGREDYQTIWLKSADYWQKIEKIWAGQIILDVTNVLDSVEGMLKVAKYLKKHRINK